jgi:hypothetical protein
MLTTAPATIDDLISDTLKQTDEASLRKQYSEQDEFVIVEDFLPQEILSRWEMELETLKPHIHRNYLPWPQEGGQRGVRHGACTRALDYRRLSLRAVDQILSPHCRRRDE